MNLTKLAPSAFAVAALLVAAPATASADPQLDLTATVTSTTYAAGQTAGQTFTSALSVVDNLATDNGGDGSEECAVASISPDSGTLLQCTTILRLKNGEIHIGGLYKDGAPTGTGVVLGGTSLLDDGGHYSTAWRAARRL